VSNAAARSSASPEYGNGPLIGCHCGKVQGAATGSPILTVVCYCDDCQAAGRLIEALPGASAILDYDGGTALTLFRKDQFAIVVGHELVVADKLRPDSATSRMVASCCNSALYIGFDKGPFWVSVMRNRIDGAKPPIEVRTMTKYRENSMPYADNAAVSRGFSMAFAVKLVRAWITMLLGR
jgi:hypothetical protein